MALHSAREANQAIDAAAVYDEAYLNAVEEVPLAVVRVRGARFGRSPSIRFMVVLKLIGWHVQAFALGARHVLLLGALPTNARRVRVIGGLLRQFADIQVQCAVLLWSMSLSNLLFINIGRP